MVVVAQRLLKNLQRVKKKQKKLEEERMNWIVDEIFLLDHHQIAIENDVVVVVVDRHQLQNNLEPKFVVQQKNGENVAVDDDCDAVDVDHQHCFDVEVKKDLVVEETFWEMTMLVVVLDLVVVIVLSGENHQHLLSLLSQHETSQLSNKLQSNQPTSRPSDKS